jgi:hypothetical protein
LTGGSQQYAAPVLTRTTRPSGAFYAPQMQSMLLQGMLQGAQGVLGAQGVSGAQGGMLQAAQAQAQAQLRTQMQKTQQAQQTQATTLAKQEAQKQLVFEAKWNLAQATTAAENTKQKLLAQLDASSISDKRAPESEVLFKWLTEALTDIITTKRPEIAKYPLLRCTAAVYRMILRPRDAPQLLESKVWAALDLPQFRNTASTTGADGSTMRSQCLANLVVLPLYYRVLLDIAAHPKDNETVEAQALRLLSLLTDDAQVRFRVTMIKSTIIQNVDGCDPAIPWSPALQRMVQTSQTGAATEESIERSYVTVPTNSAESFDGVNLLAPYTAVQPINCYESNPRGNAVAIATVTTKIQALGDTVVVYVPSPGVAAPATKITHGGKTYTLQGTSMRGDLDDATTSPYTVLCYENESSAAFTNRRHGFGGIFILTEPVSGAAVLKPTPPPLSGAASSAAASTAGGSAASTASGAAASTASGSASGSTASGKPDSAATIKIIDDLVSGTIAAYSALQPFEKLQVEKAVKEIYENLRKDAAAAAAAAATATAGAGAGTPAPAPSISLEKEVNAAFSALNGLDDPKTVLSSLGSDYTQQLTFIVQLADQITKLKPTTSSKTSGTFSLDTLKSAAVRVAGAVGSSLLKPAITVGAAAALTALSPGTATLALAAGLAYAYNAAKKAAMPTA